MDVKTLATQLTFFGMSNKNIYDSNLNPLLLY